MACLSSSLSVLVALLSVSPYGVGTTITITYCSAHVALPAVEYVARLDEVVTGAIVKVTTAFTLEVKDS